MTPVVMTIPEERIYAGCAAHTVLFVTSSSRFTFVLRMKESPIFQHVKKRGNDFWQSARQAFTR